ncbi:MAG: GNAT family N-acetyltransferase [Atopobium sp.]|nr:GNAT family N-acetyltransferase [Atopobium sp.]
MSADTPIIVPFEDTDLPELISIVERVWYLDGDESKETSRSLATIDIAYYIGVSTHRFVAKQNGQILGLIFCSNGETPADFEKWQKLENETTAKAKKLFSEADFKGYEICGDVESHLVHNYWNTNTNDAKWEITLFCVSPAAQGKGVGGMLFSYMLNFLKEQGAKHYFLATDDDCDISFYQHNGLTCKDEAPVKANGQNFGFAYIYAGDL